MKEPGNILGRLLRVLEDRFWKFFSKEYRWSLTLGEQAVQIDSKKGRRDIAYKSITSLRVTGKYIYMLEIKRTEGESMRLLFSRHKEDTMKELRKELAKKVIEILTLDMLFRKEFDEQAIYLSKQKFLSWYEDDPNKSVSEQALKLYSQVRKEDETFTVSGDVKNCIGQWEQLRRLAEDEKRELYNEGFVKKEKKRHQDFFRRCGGRGLTDEQIESAIVMEDNNLLIAAAGSGKTSAVVGKVEYAIQSGFCRPAEILVLAYNRSASEELKERICDADVKVSTLHAFGKQIIGRTRKRMPDVAEWAGNLSVSSDANRQWDDLLSEAMETKQGFRENYVEMMTVFRWGAEPVEQFETRHDYESHLESIGAKKHDRNNWGVNTIHGDWVRSLEELAIANWLYLHNVNYKYERPYCFDARTSERRQYKPDFYYPDVDVYHEHFAINAEGKCPPFFNSRDKGGDTPSYIASMEWKREIHKKNGTHLIETTSAMFRDGTVFERLRSELEEHGVDCSRKRPPDEVEKALKEQRITPLFELMGRFLKHWKASRKTKQELLAKASLNGFNKKREALFLDIMADFREVYEDKLREKEEIDYEDMLIEAADCVARDKRANQYSLVIVDEFQDVSQGQADLLMAMKEGRADRTLFAVGDDWQSIYRFAGSDVSKMLDFPAEFGVTREVKLTKTFRSNQGIINVATKFITANESQIKKEVTSTNPEVANTVEISYYFKDEQKFAFIECALGKIVSAGERGSVFILGRYNRQEPTNEIRKWKTKFKQLEKIEFRTVHKAKGGEADYVFILDMQKGAFPCERYDDSILNLVLPASDKFQHAEERRLFYVALTRAKKKVFILASAIDPSVFVNELCSYEGKEIFCRNPVEDVVMECLECGGRLVEREGRNGKFLGCANYPKCEYTRSYPKCAKCDSRLVKEQVQDGEFLWRCTNAPKCRYTQDYWECQKCGGWLVEREGRNGKFLGCVNYPSCRHTQNVTKGERRSFGRGTDSLIIG